MQSASPSMIMWDASTMGMVPVQNQVMGGHVFGGQQMIPGEHFQVISQPQVIHDGQGMVWVPQQSFPHQQHEEDLGYQLQGLVPGQIPCMNQQIVMVPAPAMTPSSHMQSIQPELIHTPAHMRPQPGFLPTSAEPMGHPPRQVIQTADGMQFVAVYHTEAQQFTGTQKSVSSKPLNPTCESFPPNSTTHQIFEERPRLTPRRRNGFHTSANKPTDTLSWRRKSSEHSHHYTQSVAVRRRSQSPADGSDGRTESSSSDSIIPKPNKRLATLLPPSTVTMRNGGPAPADIIEAYNSEIWRAPDHRNLKKLLEIIEYYFSDDSLTKNGYMLKQISGKGDGFVSIKKVASLKRIKQITRDLRTVVYSIRHSNRLELSEDGLMVRRKKPLPDNLEAPRFIRSILAINLPTENPTVEDVTSWFIEYGELTQVRILRPGKTLPAYLKDYTAWVPDLGQHHCAVVEFESQDEAQKACREINMKNRERFNLRVALLKPGARIRRTLYRKYKDSDEKCDEGQKNQQTANTRRARCYSHSSEGSDTPNKNFHQKDSKVDIKTIVAKKKEIHCENAYDASGSDTGSGSDSDLARTPRDGMKTRQVWKSGSHSDSGYSHSSSSDERENNSRQKTDAEPKITKRKSSIGEKKYVDGIPVGVLRQPKGPSDDALKGFEPQYRVIDSV